jgi:phosphatidylserine/phosphatidylglycerophosphate/cardiolipin synthase-like enzyme
MSLSQSHQVDFEEPMEWSRPRARPSATESTYPNATPNFSRSLPYERAIDSGSPLLLQNDPATYAAMFEAIRSVTDGINLETYVFQHGEVGRQVSDLLLERQRQVSRSM